MKLIVKLIKFIIRNSLLIAIILLCYIRYTQRVEELGQEPTCNCALCGEEVPVVSTHWFHCGLEWLDKQINE